MLTISAVPTASAAVTALQGFAYRNATYLGPLTLTIDSRTGSGPAAVAARISFGGTIYAATARLSDPLPGGGWVGTTPLKVGGASVGSVKLFALNDFATWGGTLSLANSPQLAHFVVNNPLLPDQAALRVYFGAKGVSRSPQGSGAKMAALSDPTWSRSQAFVDPGGSSTDPNVQGNAVWGGPSGNWFYAEAVGVSHLAPNSWAYWSNRLWLTNAGYAYFSTQLYEYIWNVQYAMTNTNGSSGFGLSPSNWIVLPQSGSPNPITLSVGYAFFSASVSVPTNGCGCGYTATGSWTQSGARSSGNMLYNGESNTNGTAANHAFSMQGSTPPYSIQNMRTDVTVETYDQGVITDYGTSFGWTVSAY